MVQNFFKVISGKKKGCTKLFKRLQGQKMKLQNFTLWLSEAEAGLVGAGKTNGECGESKLTAEEPID